MPNPILFAKIAEKLLGVVEKFLDPKQYDIVRMKRLKKAANLSEKQFTDTYDFMGWVEDELVMNEEQHKEFKKFKKTFTKRRERLEKCY